MNSLLAAVVLLGCNAASTTIESESTAPGVSRSPRNVIALFNAPDGSLRRVVEDSMAKKLRRRGVSAHPAYSLLRRGDSMTRSELSRRGFDAIVEIRLVGATGDFRGPTWSMYSNTHGVESVVRFEVTLYSLLDDRVAWSMFSKTVDPVEPTAVIDDVTTLAARQIACVSCRVTLR